MMPSMSATTTQDLTTIDLQEARDWIADCFEDAPGDLTNWEVIDGIKRKYLGGLDQFIAGISKGKPIGHPRRDH